MENHIDPSQAEAPKIAAIEAVMGADQSTMTAPFARMMLGSLIREGKFEDLPGARDEVFAAHVREVFATLYGATVPLEETSGPEWARDEIQALAASPEVQALAEVGIYDPASIAEAARIILEERLRLLELEDIAKDETEGKPPGTQEDPEDISGDSAEGDGLSAIALKAVEDAREKAKETARVRIEWGLGPGQLDGESPVERFELKDLAKIAELAGRAAQSAYGSRAKVSAPVTPVALERGREVERYTPTELALFADPLTREISTERWLTRSALQFRKEGDDRAGRGPLILAIDVSGSMSQKLGDVTREVWARAIALALADIATAQGRAVRLLAYDDGIHFDECPRTKTALREVLSRSVGGGGTNLPLVYESLLRNPPTGTWSKADLVVVSDGEDRGWGGLAKKLRTKFGVRSHGIGIVGEWPAIEKKALTTFVQVQDGRVELETIYQAI